MVAWESHDVLTKKTQEWRQEQVLGSHAPARSGSRVGIPTGDCGAVPVTEQGYQSLWGGLHATGRWRAEQKYIDPSLVEAGGQGLGPAAKEGRAPGILSGSQDTLWDHEGTTVCHVGSSQQLLGPQGSKLRSIVGNVCWKRGRPQLTAEMADIRGDFQDASAQEAPTHREGTD